MPTAEQQRVYRQERNRLAQSCIVCKCCGRLYVPDYGTKDGICSMTCRAMAKP